MVGYSINPDAALMDVKLPGTKRTLHIARPDVLVTDRKGARSGVFWLENPHCSR